MKNNELSILVLICLMPLFFACSNPEKTTSDQTIDVASAYTEQPSLKASDYFKEIRYLPLETTDESLIGNNPDIQVIDDRIIVTTSQRQCLAFDKTTGKFIGSIGHIGDDPEGYLSVDYWADPANRQLFFPAGNVFVCYTLDGDFVRKVEMGKGAAESFSFTSYTAQDDGYIGHTDNSSSLLTFMDHDGEVKDSIRNDHVQSMIMVNDIASVSVLRVAQYGPAAQRGCFIIEAKDPAYGQISFNSETHFWQWDDNTYFKESLNDTIYRIEGHKLVVDRIFDLGQYRWPIEEKYKKSSRNRIYINHILENDNTMLFRFASDLLTEREAKIYNAMLNKKSGELKIDLFEEGIEDDLTHFLLIQPQTVTKDGEYVSLIEAYKVADWFEENEGELSGLENLSSEDNPVVVFYK